MIKRIAKYFLSLVGIKNIRFGEKILYYSINSAIAENGYGGLIKKLRIVAPDISNQESSAKSSFNEFWELKRRSLHAFQCSMMLKALKGIKNKSITVVDIGDSAGTHMLYIKELTKGQYDIDTISVNLDPRAIKRIAATGQKAMLCRAEDLDLGEKSIDLFTTFQMVEHLHNPAIFFRRLAVKSNCDTMVVTVPYLETSRVGFDSIRKNTEGPIYAEDEHIFELSPFDWELLIKHSGWKVESKNIYYQYPKKIPLISALLKQHWIKTDYEGFLGMILKKEVSISNRYQDWGE